jgi:molybdopterin/thiamine biosynthesis adenylyltransferase/DNA-binding transcriptional regulator YhcF (GntR family)
MGKLRIHPVTRVTLSEAVSGRLAALILDGRFKPGEQLPPERELISMLNVSRSTLREGLRVLAENRLLDVRPGVGTYVRGLNEANYAQAVLLAGATKRQMPQPAEGPASPVSPEPSIGLMPLPVGGEKPLKIPNLHKDRLGTFDFISWWERDKVAAARIMVVGAGALGNEVVKNLSLMGVGRLLIVDFDQVEAANLARSVLFREQDNGRSKAEIAAARARELNPDVHVQFMNADVTTQVGLGLIRRMDVVIGCLDNREARLAINRFCYWMGKPWVDGAIQELLGLARVFVPGQGACYECTLTEQARRDMSLRYSCPLLARQDVLLGKVPTTPTIASIIGGIQSQEALKLLHGLPVESGKVLHFNGMTNQVHTTAYLPREDCESHWQYGEVVELPQRASATTLGRLLQIAQADLGPHAVLDLDQELVLSLECHHCQTSEPVMQPLSQVASSAAACPTCGTVRQVNMTHTIGGQEAFLHRTLASVGVPPLHIVRAHNGQEFRFYELTGDLEDALHFRHFESLEPAGAHPRHRIRLGPEVAPPVRPAPAVAGRIRFRD